MSDASARFGLPFLAPGQAQKEFFHNEALATIDAGLHPAVEGAPANVAPTTPTNGKCWLVGAGAGGAWAGKGGQIAVWTASGWRFVPPQPGMLAWDKQGGFHRSWTGSAWNGGEFSCSAIRVGGVQVVGARQPSVPNPSGGTIIDAEARAALSQVIVALKSHGLID